MSKYSSWTNNQLAHKLSEVKNWNFHLCMQAVRSSDPALGREYVISMIETSNRHEQLMEKIDETRQKLRHF
jgi:hypothetical protein